MAEPKTRPILFSGPMVRAILHGRKTQTRRVLKPQPPADMALVGIYAPKLTAVFGYVAPDADCKIPLRYIPGDLLWVRESVWQSARYPGTLPSGEPEPTSWLWGRRIHYAIDGNPPNVPNRHYPEAFRNGAFAAPDPDAVWLKRPSIHMPRWASRLTLRVTDVRVQRVQDITKAHAIAEGCAGCLGPNPCFPDEWDPSPDEEFRDLWERLNAPRGFGWEANPWVAAITFEPFAGNVGAPADWIPIAPTGKKEIHRDADT
ncbi:hypothetical protein [Microbaculum marinisediminis]|uniref:Uncharacterized protein n=1 Tax=Microbaculum marinisediminis TaxID=2931392 RepID=A0AAW5QRV9_9HYPH|nr:hypothetical protein [Microbaculum sp. A6E488]MCT8970607.1 hypothetical protein [Microbaculum sp. A6E488]